MGSIHPSSQISSFNEPTITPQVAIVSGGVEGLLTSPSPPGKYIDSNMGWQNQDDFALDENINVLVVKMFFLNLAHFYVKKKRSIDFACLRKCKFIYCEK